MIKPIVSMNKMAMNESVATTCCFAEVIASSNKLVWDVQHGGYLGTTYVDNSAWNNKYNKSWKMLSYDVTGSPDAFTLHLTKDADGKDVFTVADGTNAWGLADALAGSMLNKGAACTHDGEGCFYYSGGIVIADNQHIDSTSKHTTGGDDWAKPHKATKHNS